MNNKVLFVAYHFPPDAAVGALRTQKFVKYLPKHGWQPFVLTVKEQFYPICEPARLHDVKDAVVERTSFWRTPWQLLIDFRDNHIRKKTAIRMSSGNTVKQTQNTTSRMSAIKRFLVGLNHFPDDYMFWLFPAFRKGIRLIQKNDIRLIVVSTPPRSSIILAYLLAVFTGAKLVVDFRDPWNLNYEGAEKSLKPDMQIAAEQIVQRRILKRTSAVLTTNDFFRSALLREHPFLKANSVHVIHNGFDLSDFPQVDKRTGTNKYVISYVVSYYMQHTPADFLNALSIFMSEKGLSGSDLEMRFIGDIHGEWVDPVSKLIEDKGLEDVVRMTGRLPYAQSLALMMESSLLVITYHKRPYQIPAKMYEYMGAGAPILALIDPGAATALMDEMHAGIWVKPHDIDGMGRALHRLYDDYLNGDGVYAYDASVFERRNQSVQLAKILEKVSAPILPG